MSVTAMRQMEERHTVHPIEKMLWCTRMDLVAMSNSKGEVLLHRLNWHRAWCLSPPLDSPQVRGIAWRPDGKVIAVGYSSGQVLIVDVENKETLHSFHVPGDISCLNWMQQGDTRIGSSVPNTVKHKTEQVIYHDHTTFLPRLPVLNTSYSNNKKNVEVTCDSKYIQNQNMLNMLIIGLRTGIVHLSVFGLFPCGVIDLKIHTNHSCVILEAKLSDTFDNIYVFVADDENNIKLVTLKSPVLSSFSKELHALAVKHGCIINLMNYMKSTIDSIVEAWETVLLEMDTKLTKYAASVPEGGVSADFLDLLMFGTASDELETFLLQDLTEKGLKKLGNSIELSYSTIQKLVLKNLNTVGQALTYHLSELRGMARLMHKYKALGLDESLTASAITASGSFLIKVIEVQQVIDHSMKNYKAFFRWLYVVIVRLMDERVPNEIVEMSQQELKYIAEFLENIDGFNMEQTDIKRRPFNLERLGQYLENNELTLPPDVSSNPWNMLLKENECLSAHPCIIPHHESKSLIQQHEHFKDSIEQVFKKPELLIGEQFVLNNMITCMKLAMPLELRVSHINIINENTAIFAMLDGISPANGIYFFELCTDTNALKCAYFYFTPPAQFNDSKLPKEMSNLKPIDVQFYSPEFYSVLLEQQNEYKYGMFFQLSIKAARERTILLKTNDFESNIQYIPKINVFSTSETSFSLKPIDYMCCSKFSVSSSRKVAIILSSTCKKVRVYEMEVEEDEEDEDADITRDSESSLIGDLKDTENILDVDYAMN